MPRWFAAFWQRVPIMVGVAAVLVGVPSGAVAQVRVFSVAGGDDVGEARVGGAATQLALDGYSFSGAPAALSDGSFLLPDDFDAPRIVRVTTGGRWWAVAGGRSWGPRGDGGPASKASFRRPVAVAPLLDGGFLVSDDGDLRVRRVFPDGRIRTVAGTGRRDGPLGDGGPATRARLRDPAALAVLPDGAFLVVDDARVRRVAPDGTISTFAGTGRAGSSGDGGLATSARIDPEGLAAQPDGSVLIAGGQRVRRVGPDGTITTVAGTGRAGTSGDGGPAVRASIAEVSSVHALAEGGFLLADPRARRVRKVDGDGVITTLLGPPVFRDFARRAAYVERPFSVTTVPDGLLMHNSSAILYVPTATPVRPAIRIGKTLVGRDEVRLDVDAAQAGTATVRIAGSRRALGRSSPLAAGPGTVRFDPGRRSGVRQIRIELRAGAGIATDSVPLVLGQRLRVGRARETLDDLLGGGDEGYYYGPNRCRRFGPRRVDCQIAELFIRLDPSNKVYRARCMSVRALTVGRDGLLHQRRYRCPRRGQPVFRRHPEYGTPPTVLPLSP